MEGGYQKQNELNRKHFSLLLKRISKHSFNSRLAHLPQTEKNGGLYHFYGLCGLMSLTNSEKYQIWNLSRCIQNKHVH